jgi:rubrerythrin
METDIYAVIDFAISEEIRFQKIYTDAAEKTENNALKITLNDLAAMEKTHEEKLKAFKEGKIGNINTTKTEDLKISDYMEETEISEQSSIQDILVFAMKSEKKASDLYTKLSRMDQDEIQKNLFLSLANEELLHKNRLEKIYEDNFMTDN